MSDPGGDASQKLRESQERLELALEASGDGLFDYDFATGCVKGNERLCSMIGYRADELAHVSQWEAITHPDDLGPTRSAIWDHVKRRTPLYRKELRLKAKSGEWRWILDRGKVVERDVNGRAVRLAGFHTDITERKQLEVQVQLASRVAAIGTLAAGLAHELNTPLTTLTYGLEVVSRSLPEGDATAAEAFALVKDATERMSEIVRDVRGLSRADDVAVRERIDVAEVLRRAIRLTRHVLTERATLTEIIGAVPTVMGNASRLGEVFMNVLMNAAQSIPPGSPAENQISVVARTDAHGNAVISIRDTGGGISPETANRVFDPFFTTKPVGEGTGLGLAICHRIVTELSGKLTFESAVGIGTTFTLELPTAPALSRRRRKNVLVIDDHRGVGTTLKLLFKDSHDVDVCTTAADALKRLLSPETGQPTFDVVLCDLMMPGMNGMELFRVVERKSPEIAARFVFMTGGAPDKEARAFLASSRNTVLEKPVPPEVLSGLLERL